MSLFKQNHIRTREADGDVSRLDGDIPRIANAGSYTSSRIHDGSRQAALQQLSRRVARLGTRYCTPWAREKSISKGALDELLYGHASRSSLNIGSRLLRAVGEIRHGSLDPTD